MEIGESPLECACREAEEETGLKLKFSDFKPFGYVSEKNYEGDSHWLMFLFDCLYPIDRKPKDFDEGCYEFFCRQEIDKIKIPPSDSKLVWPFYDRRHEGFFGVNADCSQSEPKIRIEADPNL
jgi:8-oxo-dGTP diphosphatase